MISHQIMEEVDFFDDKMRNFTQTGEASVLFHDFLILISISDIFVNYILFNKWK